MLETYLRLGGFGIVWTEYQFFPDRKWRADYYLPQQEPPVIIEYDGLLHHGANHGHVSISGVLADVEKFNTAIALGLRVFRAHAKNIADGSFFTLLDSQLAQKERETSCDPTSTTSAPDRS